MDSGGIMDKTSGMTRRLFLKAVGLSGISLILPTWTIAGQGVQVARGLYKVNETRALMGTFLDITLMHNNTMQAQDIINQTFQETERLISILNRFDASSPVSFLNEKGYIKGAPCELTDVVNASINTGNKTKGMFDITILPLLNEIQKHDFNKGDKIAASDLKPVLELVGQDKVVIKDNQINLKNSGMSITLDGIAKGYIVDKACEFLLKKGVKHALINAGGDIRAIGTRMGKKPWKVGIQAPGKRNEYLGVIRLDDKAIATSGDYEVFFDDKKLYHHIISPVSGISAPFNTSVSVLANTAMVADSLSTATMIMRPDEGRGFIAALEGIEGVIIDKGLKKYRTPGLRFEAYLS